MFRWVVVAFCILFAVRMGWAENSGHNLDAMVARHAAANGVPVSLVRRVIHRESRGNPRAVSKGNYGLMQIRLGTARSMGYRGSAAGLLNPETNMTYAVKYLAGAYHAAGGNEARAQSYYQTGYYGRGRGTAVASRRSATPAYAQASFGNWQFASATPAPRNRHARVAAQTTPTMFNWQTAQPTPQARQRSVRYATQPAPTVFNWQVAQTTPSRRHRNMRYATGQTPSFLNWNVAQTTPSRHQRNMRYATGQTPSLFNWNVAQTTPSRRHRNMRYATGQTPSFLNWSVAQTTPSRRHRNMRYATGRTPSLFNWNVASATPSYSHRSYRPRHSARSTPSLMQSLKKLLTPRYRVARLNRSTTR